ncbi:hypothetical protein MMC13_000099 [Lambiella insularis]|nr:hypothetical protein [Lambiella insularis]
MSATNTTDFPPFGDKDLDAFTPPLDGSFHNFFDQYFSQDEDFPDSSDNSNESNFFEDLDMGVSAIVPLVEPTPSKAALPQYQPLHSWRANAWRQHKVTPVSQSQKLVHRMRPDGVAISSTELLSLEGKLQGRQADASVFPARPSTPPITPRRTKQSPRSGSPVTPTRGIRQITKSTTSSKMMRPSRYAKQESPSIHEWTERFQQFSLQGQPSNLPLSPPSSSKVPQHERPPRLVLPHQNTVPISPVSPTTYAQPTSRPQRQSRTSSSEVYTPTMQEARHSALWMQIPDLDFTTAALQPQLDWSTIQHPLEFYGQTPGTQNQIHPLDFTDVPTDFASQGLMIQCDPFGDVFQDIHPSGEYVATAFEPFFAEPTIEGDEVYSLEFPSGTTSRKSKTKSAPQTQSPSPPPTPLSTTKSRRHARHVRGKSSSSSAPKTPKTPTAGTGSAGFVNFTPSDSRKILTGVAPSGSSKTKARREKEASDRRRKLSEAAAKAVMEAGGDVEALRKEGLLL